MKKIILLIPVFVLVMACHQAENETENLKIVLREYFDGIKKGDVEKMNQLTTPDFVLFEDGKIFNNDSLINLIGSFSGFSAEFTFSDMKVSADNSVGNIRYFNRGDFIFNDTQHVTMNWLESASFKKVDDQWKIDFLHSTVRK